MDLELSTATTLGMALVAASLIMPAVLAWMAKSRGLSRPPWAILGPIPLINVIAFVLLALKPPHNAGR